MFRSCARRFISGLGLDLGAFGSAMVISEISLGSSIADLVGFLKGKSDNRLSGEWMGEKKPGYLYLSILPGAVIG